AVSAKVNGEPCVAYMGAGSAGHFVKMVHNGIEYGLMQIISETFDFMQRVLKMDYAAMSKTFAEWNDSELNSFLVEITAEVLRKADPDTGNPLVSMILDTAGQKGTGKWTSQAAMDYGIPIPTIDSAVSMRQISSQKATRAAISKKYSGSPESTASSMATLDDLKKALLCSFIATYAQGLSMLQAASTEKNYGLDLAATAKIWRGGCIIRSALLEEMRVAYSNDAALANLLLDDKFAAILDENNASWRAVIGAFTADGIPSLCFSSALSYFEAFRTERLPANLIQAQRDFFGAHTYQRIDKEGTFHTPDWEK
ncbi:MAG: NADP-dependent phosphogluconate dehydrogenase, partial [Acidobacteriota bacterium]